MIFIHMENRNTNDTEGIIRKLKVGDKIDLIGTCWSHHSGDNPISLGFSAVDADAICLLG
jgi:hypothetical protein